jgi:hypothetical protein
MTVIPVAIVGRYVGLVWELELSRRKWLTGDVLMRLLGGQSLG